MRKFGPCKIMRMFDSGNAYEVELPNDMDISPIFNVANLYECHESDDEVVVPKNYPKKQLKRLNRYWIGDLARKQEERVTLSIW